MTREDLIESPPRSSSALHRRGTRVLRHPAAVAVLLVLGVIAGAIGGFLAGNAHPRTLAGLGLVYISPGFGTPGIQAFERTYGRAPLQTLTPEDLSELGEEVFQEVSVVSAQSVIPVLCDTSIGQPGTPNYLDLRYPAIVFRVDGGEMTELVWPHVDEAAATGALHTLVLQAQQCPDVPNFRATISATEVQYGIGHEYAIFSRQPAVADEPGTSFATAVLVRLGADLIEIALSSDAVAVPGAEARCLEVAAAAIRKAGGG